jgi:ribonuclease HII
LSFIIGRFGSAERTSLSNTDLWTEEKQLFPYFSRLAGLDEAGRGPLAGPVVAASVSAVKPVLIPGVNDSKQLSPVQRKKILEQILTHPDLEVGVGECSPEEIDEHNILQASLLAFAKAVKQLKTPPDFCLLDGNQKSPYLSIPQKTLVQGDSRSFLIAAASIVAKETRDRIMELYHEQWPQYGFKKHKGYPTKTHLLALEKEGPCPIHRKSFAPVKKVMKEKNF